MRKLMRLIGMAEYGWDELLLMIAATAVAEGLLRIFLPPILWPLMLLPLIPLGVVVWFFRDPDRRGPNEPNTYLSPADGTVADIIEVDAPDFICGKALRIGIFLSPLNVHVNRAPCDGVVRFVQFKSGEFLPAYDPEAPTRNESASMGMVSKDGHKTITKQITGLLARRIVCEAKDGDALARGQRYGMIKFGSRTELYIPLTDKPASLVKVGDVVKGGETVLARIN
ncbi:MAG: phosphatidylserine decarboxylase [Planctomycetota bacterium]